MPPVENQKSGVIARSSGPENRSASEVHASERGRTTVTCEPADRHRDNGCPPIEQLWPAAVGEIPTDEVAQHLKTCNVCRERMHQLSHEIEEARLLLADREVRDDDCATPDAKTVVEDLAGSESGSQTTDGRHPVDLLKTATRPIAVIGRYFVLETICESGQSTVFRGLHPSLLIDVVIKLAHSPWKLDDTGRARLVSEAKALAEIVHPHLARLYDLDFYDNRPFLVLEYVRGRHLRHHRESTDLEPSQIAFLVANVARAVGAAHERGILHLDLKPENILVTHEGEPVLIDFGLSFLSPSQDDRSTEDRYIAGTPQYMSPEQTRGQREGLTQRTDVFGLGGVLYYLCVGRDPFVVTMVNGQLHRSEEPDWNALVQADVPPRLKSICRKALSAKPGSRYPTAEVLADKLEDAGRKWTRPVWNRLRKMSVVMFLLGVVSLAAGGFLPSNLPPSQSCLTLHVVRNGHHLLLPDALPLQAEDHIRVDGIVHQASHVSVLTMTKSGSSEWLAPLQVVEEPSQTRVIFPGFNNTCPVSLHAGTWLVLLVSRSEEIIRRPEKEDLIPLIDPFPSLPKNVAVSFNQGRHDLLVGPGLPLVETQRTVLDAQIQDLQLKLSERFGDFAGVFTGTP